MAKKNVTAEQALIRLETLCARSEQCQWELTRKMSTWGIDSSTQDKIMRSLIDRRFVDDHRFAQAYCRDKFSFSRWGRLKINAGLMQRFISANDIEDALSLIEDADYEAALVALLRFKVKTIAEPQSYEGKTKLFRFAVSRGFEPSVAIAVISGGKIWAGED